MTQENKNNNLHNEREKQDDFHSAKHSVKHRQLERKIRKKRKKLNALKAVLRLAVIGLLVFLGYEFCKLPQWYLPQDAFKRQTNEVIEIVNNNIIPTPIIYDLIKDIKVAKLPIFLMSVQPVKKEIFKIPVVKNVYVRRYGFPARIQIIIRERIPIAVIKTDLKNKPVAFFTSDGVLVTNKNYMGLAETDSALKILIKPSRIEKNWTAKRIDYIRQIVKSVETYSGQKVEYIDMRIPNDVYVKIQTTSIRLGVLDNSVFERIERIYTILPQIGEVNNNQVKYIDLSWDKVNYLKMKKPKQ